VNPDLVLSLKKQIIEELALEDLTPEDIDAAASLFEEGLGLDSIDALSLVVILEKQYGILITDPDEGKKILHSINSIAEHIVHQRGSASVEPASATDCNQ